MDDQPYLTRQPIFASRRGPAGGILQSRRESSMLRVLWAVLPAVVRKVDDPDAWIGLRVCDGRCTYERLNCREEVVSSDDPPRRFLPALHAFEDPAYVGKLHNHRYRLAVLPFGGEGGDDLYDMDWEVRGPTGGVERGSMLVRTGRPYAIERCLEVFHAIRTRRPHYSLNLAEISEPPVRDNRLEVSFLPPEEEHRTRLRIRAALAHWIGESKSTSVLHATRSTRPLISSGSSRR